MSRNVIGTLPDAGRSGEKSQACRVRNYYLPAFLTVPLVRAAP